MNLIQMLFSAKGRIRRRDYWLWSIVTFIVYLAIYIGVAAATGTIDRMGDDDLPEPLLLTEAVLFIPMVWIGACVTAKRWHDRNKSGYMYLILLIPLLGIIWTFIECGILDGTPGRNSYGPSPKSGPSPEVVF